MHLTSSNFEKILSWQKTLEVRLNDEKRRLLKVDDIVEFENDDGEVIPCKITKLSYFTSFADLFATWDNCIKVWYDTKNIEQALKGVYTIYTPEQEKEFGVVGIEVEGV